MKAQKELSPRKKFEEVFFKFLKKERKLPVLFSTTDIKDALTTGMKTEESKSVLKAYKDFQNHYELNPHWDITNFDRILKLLRKLEKDGKLECVMFGRRPFYQVII